MEKEEKVNIELRSEKVRNIIGNEMPFFIRYGIIWKLPAFHPDRIIPALARKKRRLR